MNYSHSVVPQYVVCLMLIFTFRSEASKIAEKKENDATDHSK